MPSNEPTYTFDPNSTYVVAGGLGGIGRRLVRWMVARSARHFILLSRSKSLSDTAAAFVKELQVQGVFIATPACDIGTETHCIVSWFNVVVCPKSRAVFKQPWF